MAIADELAEALRTSAERHHVPGAAAGVLVGDECVTAAYGLTNVEHAATVTPASLFQVGSISKTFTSAAVMLLVQEGRLALEDPVARFLPDLGPATGLDFGAITVERALSHQAGFDGDHLFVRREWDDLSVLRDARRLFPPGEGYSYNNAGFSIAGAIVTAISGQSFESFTRERLLRPLGMTSASFTADEAITFSVAAPHWVDAGTAYVIRGLGWQPGWELGPVDRPAGGLIASVEQLMTWCRFQWTGTALDGSVLLTPESLTRLHAPILRATAIESIALDWFAWEVDGVTVIGHGGLTAGYTSDLSLVPGRGLAVVSLTNGTNGGALNDELRRWALHRFANLRETDPQPDADPRDRRRAVRREVRPRVLTAHRDARTRTGHGGDHPVTPRRHRARRLAATAGPSVHLRLLRRRPRGVDRTEELRARRALRLRGREPGRVAAMGQSTGATRRLRNARVRRRGPSRSCDRWSPGSPSPRPQRAAPRTARCGRRSA